jgi:hypothetical protein
LAQTHHAFIWIMTISLGTFLGMLAYFKAKSWF